MSTEIQQFTGTALTVKNDFVDPIKNAITGALPLFMREDSEAWIRGAILEISKTPTLVQYAQNNFPAFAGTLTRVAALGLPLNRDMVYVLPFGSRQGMQANVIMGWRGELELIYRAGNVETVHHEEIFENDKYEWRDGAPRLIEPAPDSERGKIRYAIAWAILRSGKTSQYAVVGVDRIAAAKKTSRGSTSPASPWVQHETAMWRKTAIHELANFVDSSVEECRPERLEAMKTRAALALDVERMKIDRMEAENRALELKIRLMELEAQKSNNKEA